MISCTTSPVLLTPLQTASRMLRTGFARDTTLFWNANISLGSSGLTLFLLLRYFGGVGDGGAAGLVKDIILDTGGGLNWLTVRQLARPHLSSPFLSVYLVRAKTQCSASSPCPRFQVDSNTQTAAASGSAFIGTPRALRLSCGSVGSTFFISEGNACVLPPTARTPRVGIRHLTCLQHRCRLDVHIRLRLLRRPHVQRIWILLGSSTQLIVLACSDV